MSRALNKYRWFGPDGYDINGVDADGFDREGFHWETGLNRDGLDRHGADYLGVKHDVIRVKATVGEPLPLTATHDA